jgi:hypothetical protein
VWLAAAFAKYERIVATEHAMKDRAEDHKLTAADREKLALALEAHRKSYLAAARIIGDIPLEKTKSDPGADWYRVAVGKGVLLLNELRKSIGAAPFDELMDQFGRAHAGKDADTASFVAFVDKLGRTPSTFWNTWLQSTPLKNGGSAFSVQSFHEERDKTLIVFGTTDDEVANRRSAEQLQRIIRIRWSNETIPIVADRDVTDEQIKNHHLVLIGRPDSNLLTRRFREALPVSFGPRSFKIGADQYAHCGSGVLASTDNPTNPRFSIVVLAGLSADATTRLPELVFGNGTQGADIVIAAQGAKARPLVAAALESNGQKK